MRVLQVAAELTPFAKTGGLGDVAAGLSKYLERAGHDVRIFLPFYSSIAHRSEPFTLVEPVQDVPIPMGGRHDTFSLLTAKLPGSTVNVCFVHCPALYEGPIYQGDWVDWLRFAFLTRAAFESCQRAGWAPDVLHVHDWHTALGPLVLRTLYGWDRLFARTRTVLTIHNLGFQGVVDAGRISDLGMAGHARLFDGWDYATGRLNFMKTGLLHADAVTAVSRTYAEEIKGTEHGWGLDPLLRAHSGRLSGIVNGVDYGEWDPETDPHIPHHYTAADLTGKRAMKSALLAAVGMADTDAPVIGLVTRLTPQKGLDLAFDVLPALLSRRDCRVIVLGSGESRYEQFFEALQRHFPGRAWFYRGYNERLSHWIEAGADLFLMPSRFEPCGLNQMYSLRYGTPPVVRKTGGLADTVQLFDSATGDGTGFVFDDFAAAGLEWALNYALDTYPHKETWARLVQNGMAQDFSWDVQGPEYVRLYERLLG
jgi:starch synthase